MVALRAERAKLLGYETFADFKLADTMAKTPDAVLELLNEVWAPARRPRQARARRSAGAQAQARGDNIAIEPWDWRYYAEQVRMARHDLDEATIKPYFQLDRIIEAAFDTAHRLFGLSFEELKDFPRYHPDIRAWQVAGRGRQPGRHLHRRLFRAALEAQRRLDERLPLAGEARPATSARSSST